MYLFIFSSMACALNRQLVKVSGQSVVIILRVRTAKRIRSIKKCLFSLTYQNCVINSSGFLKAAQFLLHDQRLISVFVASSDQSYLLLFAVAILQCERKYACVINFYVCGPTFRRSETTSRDGLRPLKKMGTQTFNFAFTRQKLEVPVSKQIGPRAQN